MVPTRRLFVLLALGVPLSALAALGSIPYFFLLYNGLVFLVCWVTYMLAPRGKGIKVERITDPVLSVRVTNQVRLRITNEDVQAIKFRYRDEPPPGFLWSNNEFDVELGPNRVAELHYGVTPDVRGADYFRGSYVRIECPLGLVLRQEKLPTTQPVRIYPNILALREFDLLRQKGQLKEVGIRKSRMRGLGTEFESLRDYAEGDDYRKIDWKASARRGKIIVRQFEQERNQAVLVVIDIGRHMMADEQGVSKLDRALDSCLMLLHAASSSGDLVGLLVYAEQVHRYIPPKKGRSQMGIILNAIHDLVAVPVESDHQAAMNYLATRWKRRSLLVAFSEVDGEEDARSFSAAFRSVTRRHLAVLARVTDSKLLATAGQAIDSRDRFYEVAAADMLTADRRKATLILENNGLHNLESDADELSANLVNFYFTVKERALI